MYLADGEENVNFNVMCRACALPFDSAVLRDITPPIREMLQFCVDIEVDPLLDMPTHICGTCYKRADDASQFKLQCQRSEQRLREMYARILMRATSTPSHTAPNNSQHSPPRTPLSAVSDLEIPLTPSGCDAAVEEILEHDKVATPSLDSTSISNFLDGLLHENVDDRPQEVIAKSPSPERSINLDSVLSFLDTDAESRISNLDDSFSLITNFGASPLKQDANDIPVTVFDKDDRVSPLSQPNIDSEGASNEKVETKIKTDIQSENDINISFLIDQGFGTIELFDGDSIKQDATDVAGTVFDKNAPASPLNQPSIDTQGTLHENVEPILETDIQSENYMNISFLVDQNFGRVEPFDGNVESLNENKQYALSVNEPALDVLVDNNNIEKKLSISHLKYYKSFEKVEPKVTINDRNICNANFCEKPVNVAVEDFIKRPMPEKLILEEFKTLGHVRCRFCYQCILKSESSSVVNSVYEHLTNYHGSECFRCNVPDYIKLCRPEIDLRKQLIAKGSKRCGYCCTFFTDAGAFYRHLHSKHYDTCKYLILSRNLTKGPFCCDYCNKEFSKKSYLSNHISRHLGLARTSMRCRTCKRNFLKKTAFQKHRLLHDEKPHLCVVCGKKYTTRHNLNVHSLRHNGDRRFACTECGKRYKMKNELTRHTKTHAKEFACPVCAQTFARAFHLRRHVSRKH